MVSGGFPDKYPRNRFAQNLDATKVYGHIWRKVQRENIGASEVYITACIPFFPSNGVLSRIFRPLDYWRVELEYI